MVMNRRNLLTAASAGAVGAVAFPAPQAFAAAPLAIDEGMFVDINGYPQWITIRGQDLKNPILLFLDGGPPGLGAGTLTPIFADWETRFTVVQWDQPGGGATGLRNGENTGPLNIERYVKDGLAVASYVRTRLGGRRMVLMGLSWGTLLGLIMLKRRPELFSAYVGTSQVVSGPEGSLLGYQLGLKAARERGDAAAVAALEKVGPPPYNTVEDFFVRQQYTNPPGLPSSPAEQAASAELAKLLSAPKPPGARWVANLTPPAGFDGFKVFMNVQRAMFQECGAWEARSLGLSFPVPMFVFQGENDLNTPMPLAREWLEQVRAPKKAFEIIAGASHGAGYIFHDEMLRLMERHVRPLVA
jgi:pimeloyl-ACP methyl ester carboxylesterase